MHRLAEAAKSVTHCTCEFCHKTYDSRRRLSGHRIGKHIRKVGMKNSVIRLNALSDAQKGYLAGFLDGEGGIQITRGTRHGREYDIALHPTVYFCNTCLGSVRRIKEWLGRGTLVRRSEVGNHKDTFILHTTGTRNIKELLTCLRPYLIIKTRQERVMFQYCESRLSHCRGNERRYTKQELRLYTTLKKLNRKGGGGIKRQHTVV